MLLWTHHWSKRHKARSGKTESNSSNAQFPNKQRAPHSLRHAELPDKIHTKYVDEDVVAYASRELNKTEQKYSQLEKKLYAVVNIFDTICMEDMLQS